MTEHKVSFLVGRHSIHLSGSPTCCGIIEVGQFAYDSGFMVYIPYAPTGNQRNPDTCTWYAGARPIGLQTVVSYYNAEKEISEIPINRTYLSTENRDIESGSPSILCISPATYADLVLTYCLEQYVAERHYHFLWGNATKRLNKKNKKFEVNEQVEAGYKAWQTTLEERGIPVFQLGRSRMDNYPLFLGSLFPQNQELLAAAREATNSQKVFTYNPDRVGTLNNRWREAC